MKNNKTPTVDMAGAFLNVVHSEQKQDTLTAPKKQVFCRDCKHFCDTAKTRRERTLKLGKTFCYCTGKPTAAHCSCELFVEVTA